MNELYCGIEIGGTKLQMFVGNADGKVLERCHFKVEPDKGAEGIRTAIRDSLPSLLSKFKAKAIGVGFGGPVDWQSGAICRSHQIEGWSGFNLSRWLKEITGLDVFVENDANVAALGEALCGAGKGFNPVFYMTLGSGVGGGLVVDDKIYHGAIPGEAEIGHIRLNKRGWTVESQCSGWSVDAKIRRALKRRQNTILKRLVGDKKGGEASFLRQAIDSGDSFAIKLLNNITDDLAFALSHVVHLFHPRIIIIGGGLSKVGEPLINGISQKLPNYVMDAFKPAPIVTLTGLGDDVVPVGAIKLAHTKSLSAKS